MKKTIFSYKNKLSALYFVTAILMFAFSGCTLSGIDKNSNGEITEADLQTASQVLSESLADENDGVMSSLNDALTTVSENGFVRTDPMAKSVAGELQNKEDDKTGRGRESNFSYSYDPATGTHTLTFMRKIAEGAYSKNVADTLKYIFTDNNGQFIAKPRQEKDRIETINFKGFRQGEIQSPTKNSFFSRQDTFLIDGVSQASSTLSIDGVHHGNGNLQKENNAGAQIETTYNVQINFLNISIDKEIVRTTHSLEQGITGTLSWSIKMSKSVNGSSRTKTIEGTIEMNGDGTALLRFQRFKKLFKINLDDGKVRDEENEFEGIVSSVNRIRGTFTLRGGRTVRITDNTKIDAEGDITTLQQLAHAIQSDHVVKAEGEGFIKGDVFVATEVEFESREKETGTVDFKAYVNAVDLENMTLTLRDQRVIQVTNDTKIDSSGDLQSLSTVKEVIASGQTVIVGGHGTVSNEANIQINASELRFKIVKQESFEFEGSVASTRLASNTFTLDDNRVVWINQNTKVDDSGDYTSLPAVAKALEQGLKVTVSGKAIDTDKGNIDIIAIRVRFEKEN